jgi:hypothetical protein
MGVIGVGHGEDAIEAERPLAVGDALQRALGENLHVA